MIKTGIRMQMLRKRLMYTQKQVAEKSGLSLNLIWKVESGGSQPTGKFIDKYCRAIGVSPSYILLAELSIDDRFIDQSKKDMFKVIKDDVNKLLDSYVEAIAAERTDEFINRKKALLNE